MSNENILSHSYIEKQGDLESLIVKIKKRKIIAIDTEFTRRTTYYSILSIVQIAIKNSNGKQELFIIDCQAPGLKIDQFLEIISDKNIIKIIHSCDQDLQIFYNQSNKFPAAIFDTQIMANFCGFGFNVGYSSLVEKIFNKTLDKKQQISDWQKRPLSKKQINYALLDVVFLEEIYEKFLTDISGKFSLKCYEEEAQKYIQKYLQKDNSNIIKNFNLRGKTRDEIIKLTKFIDWREDKARKVNVPRRHFMSDAALEEFAIGKLSGQNLGRHLTNKDLEEAKNLFHKKLNDSEKNSINNKRLAMNSGQKKSYNDAKKLIAKISLENNLSEQFLITSLDLKKAICDDDNFEKIISGWRYEIFGKELKKLIS